MEEIKHTTSDPAQGGKKEAKRAERERELALIQDLSEELKEVTTGKVDWIYRYQSKDKVAKSIYRDFLARNKKKGSEELSFIFSEDVPEEGILSMTQAFQTMAALAGDFDYATEEATQSLHAVLVRILDAVNPSEGVYVFDATPYLSRSEAFRGEGAHAYVDTITWVVSSLLSFFRLHISGVIEAEEALLERCARIYRRCIRCLLDSFIGGTAAKPFRYGWNFTAGCDEPSLYFTFAVSEVMIDILTSFENVIRAADIDLVCAEIDRTLGNKVPEDELAEKKEQVSVSYKEQTERLAKGGEEAKREVALFARLNGAEVYAEGSPYALLEQNVKAAAANIWELVKENISDTFFTADLCAHIGEQTIEQSVSNDALFNSVFIINTLINAGLDEDAEDKINYFTPNGSEQKLLATDDYDLIRESLRMAYDTTWQFYTRMRKLNKEYKVNEYTLSFDESFKNADVAALASDMRKARMRVFSLMPLLVKTKTTIGEFVIAYPQYDMQIYLEAILQSRYIKKKYTGEDGQQKIKYAWIWETDNYSTSSNYYFVSALADFYSYYETYEQPIITSAEDNINIKKSIEAAAVKKFSEKQHAEGGEIHSLERQLAEGDARYAALQKQYDELLADTDSFRRDPLKYGLSHYIKSVMEQSILEVMSAEVVGKLLSGMSDMLSDEAIARVARKAEQSTDGSGRWYEGADPAPVGGEVAALEAGIDAMSRALLTERLAEMFFTNDLKKSENGRSRNPQADIDVRMNALVTDLKRALRLYSDPMAKGFADSEYVRTRGYDGLVSVLQQYRMNNTGKKDDKK